MDNPMSGAPAYLVCLIENIEGRSKLRPKTGGPQHSIRIDPIVWQQISAISNLSDWSKSEIVTALIERGLYDFYKVAGKEMTQEVMKKSNIWVNSQVEAD